MSNVKPAEGVPQITLRTASVDEYCRSILATPRAEMWWFQTGDAPKPGYSRPFQGSDGHWWWLPKPRFAWAADFWTPFERPPRMPLSRGLLGYQYPVAFDFADSLAHFNVIRDLPGYDIKNVEMKKRGFVRKQGLVEIELTHLDPTSTREREEARIVWNSHVERTGWNATFSPDAFGDVWGPLADHAGTNVLGARDKQTGELCAFLITRVVGGCAFMDTIASHSERQKKRPNDTIIFIALYNAARMSGVRHANYFYRSDIRPLEKFKRSLGFDPYGLPSRLELNPLARCVLRLLKPGALRRLRGDWPPPADHPDRNAS